MRQFEILHFLVFLAFSFGQENDKLPCELSWREVSTGDQMESSLVASHSQKIFIARAKIIDYETRFILGWYDVDKSLAQFFYKEEDSCEPTIVKDIRTFEILDNPNNCNLKWGDKTSSSVNVPVGSGGFVARAPASEQYWYPGELIEGGNSIDIITKDMLESYTNYQLLTSTVGEMQLIIDDFQFDMDSILSRAQSPGTVGIDHFYNDANTYISQTVRHSRKVTERFEFPIRNEQTKISKYTDTVTKRAGFPSFLGSKTNVEISLKATMGVEEIKIEIRETELNIEKVISIPPHSAVTVCTTMDISDDVEIPYNARGVYIAGGISAVAIYEQLRAEGIDVTLTLEGNVETNIKGVFRGSLVFSSNFYAVDGIAADCSGF